MDLRMLAPVLLAAMCAAACDNTATAITPTPTTPQTTQNFSDTLTVNGGKTFEFSSTSRGAITTTVTSLAPDNAVIGIAIGTWNGLLCQQVLVKDDATQGTQMAGAVSAVGNLCLRVYDSTGTLTGPVSFSIDVAHP
jgi:hypothetical protein